MNGIYLLLGSNLGDSSEVLRRPIFEIEKSIGSLLRSSGVYKTKAWGIENQPDFLNQVLEVESNLNPESMLKEINAIEKRLGRVRYEKWHERVIDIDILYFGNHIINTADLQVPHPENQNRKFVLAPMREIAPDFVHPILGQTQIELLKSSKDPLSVDLL